jgi:Zn-dependent protease with chaperone function
VSSSPLPYHHAVVAWIRQALPAAWAHYTSDRFRADQREALRLHLLQSTVELTRAAQPELYALADAAAAALDLDVPVELYQAEDDGQPNAGLLYAPDAARVVLRGALQERLAPAEVQAVLGHELAHHVLWSLDSHAFLDAERLLSGLAGDTLAPSILETLRLYQLHVEVYADRGGAVATDRDTMITALIKVRTGLKRPSVSDFLAQSAELVDKQGLGSRAWSHPEAHIRALALARHADAPDDDASIRELVEGPLQLDALDVLRRAELDRLTRQLVAWVTAPAWMRTDAVMGHVRLLFDDDPLPEPVPVAPAALARWGDTVRDYLSAILLDFVVVDPGLDDLPLLRVDRLAEDLGLQDRLQRDVNRHLKRTRKAIGQALEGRDSRLAAADEADHAG